MLSDKECGERIMRIAIVGAARGEVTGSANHLQTSQSSALEDCALLQGGRRSEGLKRPPAGPKQRFDAVLLTHGCLNHTGRLPKMREAIEL